MDKEFDQLRKVLAHNVRTLRRAQKLSQEELGFEAEIDRTYVSQIERSIINPSLLILHRVARALKTNVPALLLKTPTPKDDTTPKSATT
jgi:transcriptional regulator with XRE-family HTH domain